MKILDSIAAVRAYTQQSGRPILVPTMGNLHAGHISLVAQAKRFSQSGRYLGKGSSGAPVMSSIFVNRLQFGPNEDFDKYPRTWEADCAALEAAGCDAVFAPNEQILYPEPQGFMVHPPSELANILEGHFRPGFFQGVCTVVVKLFSITSAQAAMFGKKDYQQQLIIQRMVSQLNLDLDIHALPTARAEDGLALSSRNIYLSAEERERARLLSQVLRKTVARCLEQPGICALAPQREAIEAQAMQMLIAQGWRPDYVCIRRQTDLQIPTSEQDALVVLAAAKLGNTRLIDNMEVQAETA